VVPCPDDLEADPIQGGDDQVVVDHPNYCDHRDGAKVVVKRCSCGYPLNNSASYRLAHVGIACDGEEEVLRDGALAVVHQVLRVVVENVVYLHFLAHLGIGCIHYRHGGPSLVVLQHLVLHYQNSVMVGDLGDDVDFLRKKNIEKDEKLMFPKKMSVEEIDH